MFSPTTPATSPSTPKPSPSTRTLTRSRYNLRRPTGFVLGNEHAVGYGYDVSGRLANLSAQGLPNLPGKSHAFEYTYEVGSSLLDKVTGPVHAVDNIYEPHRDVLLQKTNSRTVGTPGELSVIGYTVNAIGQREQRNLSGEIRADFYGGQTTDLYTTDWGNDALGQVIVHYEYDAFGPGTRFDYRLSTKPRDPATGLYYYGYRWFDPYTGRWLNRDPIEEEGGVNLYGFVGSDGLNALDYRGLLEVRVLNVPSTQQGFVDTGSIGQTDDRGGHRWAETRYRTKVEAFVEDHSDGYCKVSARIMMFYTLVVSSDLSFPPGQLEATIAHEIMHFDAMNKRLADIQRRYKPRPDSFTTYSEALRWRHNYEYLLTHAVNAAIRGEGAHRVSDGFGTPEDGLKGYLYTLDPKIKIPAIISTGINRKR